jgi:glycosyltransferase involved in cell wall biosynthesis
MRIAQIAPLFEAVPPRLYGGSERIVSYLTEALVELGHDVTLFATGDSLTAAKLVACTPRALRLAPTVRDPLAYHLVLLEEVRRRAMQFDILHFHIDLLQFPYAELFAGRMVTTLHGRLDMSDLQPFYRVFTDVPLVSISAAQRLPMPPVNWVGTVHHGLPRDLLPFSPKSQGYLAFLGRISPEKRPDRAIEIAIRSGQPLKIAAKVDAVDRDYWEQKIKPMIERHRQIEYLGEINERQKAAFLGGADALLFPIDWPEPFGLVMIEAMACGTPVIACPCGSVPEIMADGITGYVVQTVEQAVDAVGRLPLLERRRIRDHFEQRFTVERMAGDYLAIYRSLRAGAPAPIRMDLPVQQPVSAAA